jgi:hypothetical protein
MCSIFLLLGPLLGPFWVIIIRIPNSCDATLKKDMISLLWMSRQTHLNMGIQSPLYPTSVDILNISCKEELDRATALLEGMQQWLMLPSEHNFLWHVITYGCLTSSVNQIHR